MRVGDVAQVVGGGTPKTGVPEYWDGGLPWATPKDLSRSPVKWFERGERDISSLGAEKSSVRKVPRGTVLLTSRAPIGLVSLAARPVYTNQGFKSLILGDTQDPEYWYYLLKMSTGYLEARSSGSTFKELNGRAVANLAFAVPPLDEQRRIAAVLGAFDDLIETNRALSRGLEDRSLDLFSGVGFDAAPSDGETVSLSELLEVNPRLPKPTGEAAYVDMASLPTDSSRIANIVRRPAAGGARFQNGDTLLARLTPCLENGKAALVDVLEEDEVAVGSTEFLVLRDSGGLGEHWPYLLTRSARFRDYAIQNMNGSSGRQRVSAETIGRYVLRAPDPSVVNEFREQTAVAFEAISHLNEEIADLTRARDELLPLLMSGRVRVEDVEGMV